jgi:hypothetical protein
MYVEILREKISPPDESIGKRLEFQDDLNSVSKSRTAVSFNRKQIRQKSRNPKVEIRKKPKLKNPGVSQSNSDFRPSRTNFG